MRTNIDIDDELMSEAMRATGARTKKDAVDAALRTVVRRYRQRGVLNLAGKVHWEGDLDESRQMRTDR
ncbi:MAG: type II toxin-antitoxin system VapB family antitoxin [Haloechinothrix sp.]